VKTDRATQAQTAYSYDSENRLIQASLPDGTVPAYKYDALGRRVEKSTGAVTGPTVTRYIYEDVPGLVEKS
jgi:YD repeat-containing protein